MSMEERSDEKEKEKDGAAIPTSSSAISKSPNKKVDSINFQIRHGHGHGPGGGKKANQIRVRSIDGEMLSSVNGGDSSSIGNARYDHSLSFPVTNASAGITAATTMDDDGVSLSEYTAAGGTGIFKPPTRSAVHPGRPPALELRPHPLRETQVGKFFRTMGCTHTQVWAGQESGVRFWNIKDAFEPGSGLGGKVRRGDEDAAPFYESANTSPSNCIMLDHGNNLVWTGHKDGKIRSWKMDQNFSDDATPFREGLSWQAHRAPILAIAMSCYGDMWAGSEGGMIKMWPWESIEKSLALSSEEKHMAALLVERTNIDLRAQVTVNGICNISSSDVKVILSDYSRGRMWCATSMSFSLWDARTRELVKVFNIEGQIENRVEMPVASDQAIEEETKAKQCSNSKKEKPQGFLQRSRNAIMGAADAVRRVASRGTNPFNDQEHKKTEAMILTANGIIWSGCSNGLLIQWDWNGNRLQDFNHNNNSAVLCFCTRGSRLWVGYASGLLQLLDLDGNVITGWVAHSSPNIKLGIGGGYLFSLAIHGGIRAWHLISPGPIDNIIRIQLAEKEALYTRRESVKILIGTWNVGQGKAPHEGLKSWLGSVVGDIGIVVVGLQEVEMGAGFLAMSAAKETVGLEGSAMGQHWQDAIGRVIEEGLLFERVGSRQLASMLIAIWVRKTLRPHVGDLDVAAVACGLGRTIGNKGGVGLRLRVHDRIICFVNCHLAAHLEAVNRRNADFSHIYRTMAFSRQSNLLSVAAAGAANSSTAQNCNPNSGSANSEESGKLDLSEADMVVFTGDFNYRLFGLSYDEARDFVSQRSFDWLREKDQLREEMKQGRVFMGMREAVITFPPTYKFEKYIPGLGGYDSGEKKRIPAWCDRVIYRDCSTGEVEECSLECPIIAAVKMYEACMDVNDSDHKPVRCKISVQIARIDRSVRRKELGEIMNNNDEIKKLVQEYLEVPETSVSTNEILLQNQEPCIFQIHNKSQKDKSVIHIVCHGMLIVSENTESPSLVRPRGSLGFPPWLEVIPSCGVIRPEESMEFSVGLTDELIEKGGGSHHHIKIEEKAKEVMLTVQVGGSSSLESKTHQIRVRNCFSKLQTEFTSKRVNDGSHHRRRSDSHLDTNYETTTDRR